MQKKDSINITFTYSNFEGIICLREVLRGACSMCAPDSPEGKTLSYIEDRLGYYTCEFMCEAREKFGLSE